MTSLIATCPKSGKRESYEFGRLSPITNTWSRSTVPGTERAPVLDRVGLVEGRPVHRDDAVHLFHRIAGQADHALEQHEIGLIRGGERDDVTSCRSGPGSVDISNTGPHGVIGIDVDDDGLPDLDGRQHRATRLVDLGRAVRGATRRDDLAFPRSKRGPTERSGHEEQRKRHNTGGDTRACRENLRSRGDRACAQAGSGSRLVPHIGRHELVGSGEALAKVIAHDRSPIRLGASSVRGRGAHRPRTVWSRRSPPSRRVSSRRSSAGRSRTVASARAIGDRRAAPSWTRGQSQLRSDRHADPLGVDLPRLWR